MLEKGEVQMFNHLDKGDEIDAETGVSDVDASDYDALVLPGGVANPDQLRTAGEAWIAAAVEWRSASDAHTNVAGKNSSRNSRELNTMPRA